MPDEKNGKVSDNRKKKQYLGLEALKQYRKEKTTLLIAEQENGE